MGPVAGAIMACFLVMALGVYCYHHRAHRAGEHYMSAQEQQYHVASDEQVVEDLDPENEGYLAPSKC